MFGFGHEELRRELHRLEMRIMQLERDYAQQQRLTWILATRFNKLCTHLGVHVTYEEPRCKVIKLETKGKTDGE